MKEGEVCKAGRCPAPGRPVEMPPAMLEIVERTKEARNRVHDVFRQVWAGLTIVQHHIQDGHKQQALGAFSAVCTKVHELTRAMAECMGKLSAVAYEVGKTHHWPSEEVAPNPSTENASDATDERVADAPAAT